MSSLQKRGARNVDRATVWRIILAIAVFAISLGYAFNGMGNSVYWSKAQVFGEFLNSPLVLVFPVVIAIMAGLQPIGEISHRFMASTRTREDIRQRLLRQYAREVVWVSAIFASLAVVSVVCAWFVVPAIWPEAIDSAGMGIRTEAELLTADAYVAPLAAATAYGPWAFAVVTALWLGGNAAIFAVISISAVYLFKRPLIALSVPFLIYAIQSTVMQFSGLGKFSLTISAMYPGSMSGYSLLEALVPSVTLGIVAVASMLYVVLASRTNSRFS